MMLFVPLLFGATATTAHVIPLVPHHVQQQRRQLYEGPSTKFERPHRYPRWLEERELDDIPVAQQIAGLFQGYGTHYADLWCGTPPQRQTVIVDTGSGITAFPCSQCQKCGVPDYHIDALFDESASSTFSVLECGSCLHGSCDATKQQCQMGQSYQEGSSWRAQEVMDLCYVGGLHTEPLTETHSQSNLDPRHASDLAFLMKFGCQTSITGLFVTQLADGIMGMDKAESSYWKQLVDAGRVDRAAFSLCYSRSPTAAREGTAAGGMSLGGSDVRWHETPMVFTDQTGSSSGFYQVYLRKAYLRNSADHKIHVIEGLSEKDMNQGNVIVDSGTTDTYFHQNFGRKFYPLFQELTGEKFGHKGMSLTQEQIDAYPTILLQLSGDVVRNKQVAEQHGGTVQGLVGELDPDHPYDVLLAIPPSHYFEYDADDKKYYARFYADEKRGSVLGANAMMGHDVLFDIDNKILGWAESHCDYNQLVERYANGNLIPDDPIPKREDQKKNSEEPSNNDEERFKPEDEDMYSRSEPPPSMQLCTSSTCQIGVTVFVVGAVIAVGYVLAQRTTPGYSGVGEELTDAELEMQSPPSMHYRDDYDNDDDDKEMPSMT
ncbi:hypothetical protein FisN_8Hh040 [Fistulifera solaris]|uniref:Peptidase A1 domain-containing protein n=1 Tax=Fistulifera solaris TaxID=1519565 RepID=A0A1Z5JJF4_FISSO|nr:hypothetical protein FisN_8Hh040 [Fistulifera solaris]|eukprot:GAX14124.1 hypothetical protein FisN_8Hh040 [Fistulifera solaris]